VELYLHSPQYVSMAWCLVKHRDNFTFTLSVMSGGCISYTAPSSWNLDRHLPIAISDGLV